MTPICSMCGTPVAKNASEQLTKYVRCADGQYDHAHCHSPEGKLIYKIFAEPKFKHRPLEQTAAQLGHEITEKYGAWSCTCGRTEPRRTRKSHEEVEKETLEHLRAVIRGDPF